MNLDAQEDRLRRALTGGVFLVALVLADLVPDGAFGTSSLLAIVALLTPVGLQWVWGERTRPRPTLGWWLLGIAVMVLLVAVGLVIVAMALIAGIFLVHDMQLTPSVLLAGGVVAAVLQPGYEWRLAGEGEAWYVALAALTASVAAVVERDRLALRDGQPVHGGWTLIRLGLLGLWTVGVVALRERLQTGRIFAWFGADPTGFEGQLLLLAILLTSLVLAGFLFRLRARPKDATP